MCRRKALAGVTSCHPTGQREWMTWSSSGISESGSSGSPSGAVDPPSVPLRPSVGRNRRTRLLTYLLVAVVDKPTPMPMRWKLHLFIGTTAELLRVCIPMRRNTGVCDSSSSFPFDSLSPILEGRELNVREDSAPRSPAMGAWRCATQARQEGQRGVLGAEGAGTQGTGCAGERALVLEVRGRAGPGLDEWLARGDLPV